MRQDCRDRRDECYAEERIVSVFASEAKLRLIRGDISFRLLYLFISRVNEFIYTRL